MDHVQFTKPVWFVGPPERTLGRGSELPVETAYFRISFNVKGKGELKASISALSRYSLYVNGEIAAHGPCKGNRMQHFCDELNLSTHLREGQNIIACKVISFPPQEGYISRPPRSVNDSSSELLYSNSGPESVIGTASGPCLLFYGELIDQSGEAIDLSTGNASWLVKNDDAVSWLHPPRTMVFCHEEVDAKKIPFQWNSETGNDTDFLPVIKRHPGSSIGFGIVQPFPLFKRPIPMLYERDREINMELPLELPGMKRFSFSNGLEKAAKVELEAGTDYFVDLDAGELTTGYVILETEGGKDAEIKLTYAESYGGPFTEGVRGDRMDYKNFSLGGFKDIYRPSGQRESYEFFWFRTFRIIRLEVKTGSSPLSIWPIKYRETAYPLEVKTTGPSDSGDNSWLNGLWDISLRTLRLCMHETYEDCPYYEQMQYIFDTRLQMLFHYYLNGDTRLGLKTIDDYHCSILPEGIIQSRYPVNRPQVIPTFAISWLSMLLDYYEQTADLSVLDRYRPTAEAIINWFKRKKNAQGYIVSLGYWEFVDWAPEWRESRGSPHAILQGPSTIQNLMYVYGLQTLAKVLDALGFKELRDYYLNEAKEICTLIKNNCWDEKKGLFREGPAYDAEYTQHAQMWAVLTNTVSGSEATTLMEKTLTEPGLIKCTFPLMFYLFRALEAANLYDKTETLWDDWKRLLSLNLSTIPETPYENSRSDCHAWSSLLLHEYPAKILGVYPLEPAYKSIGIKPQGLFLKEAAGKVHTPKGMVEVSWEVKGKDFSISGSLPEGSSGELILPNGSRENLNGGPFSFVMKA